jgi:hypothetical protein
MGLNPIKIKQKSPSFDFDAQFAFYKHLHEVFEKLWEELNAAPNQQVPMYARDEDIPEFRLNIHFWDSELKTQLMEITSRLAERIYFLKCAKALHSLEGK